MTGLRRIHSFGTAVLVAFVLASSACGGGSSGAKDAGGAGTTGTAGTSGGGGTGGTAVASGTPVALCNKVISTLCMRIMSCPGLLQDPTMFDEADCEKVENVEFGCDRAASTAFPDCVADVMTVSCASLFPSTGLSLPASCNDPLNTIPLSPAQMKCADLAGADCMRAAQCLGITPTADQLQTCQINDYNDNGCFDAVDVGATFMQCLTDLGAAPCPPDGGAADAGAADAGSLPSCDNAIVFVQ